MAACPDVDRQRYDVPPQMFSALFRALNATGVRYVVAGGVATVLHGYARLTADVDLVIDLSVFLRPLGKARPCLMTTERDQPNV